MDLIFIDRILRFIPGSVVVKKILVEDKICICSGRAPDIGGEKLAQAEGAFYLNRH